MLREHGEEVGIVGEGLDLEALPVSVYGKETGAIGGEGHLLELVVLDGVHKVRVTDVHRLTGADYCWRWGLISIEGSGGQSGREFGCV